MKNTLNEQEKLIQSKQKDFQNASIFVTKNLFLDIKKFLMNQIFLLHCHIVETSRFQS